MLTHWTAVAQRAVALPKTLEGDRLRAAVPHLIALQAVALALDHADLLPVDEHALGMDRAEILVREHGGALRALFADAPMPEAFEGTLRDVAASLHGAREIGLGWTVATDALTVEHPAQLVAALLASGFEGDLLLPRPGGALFRTSPCAFVRAPRGGPGDEALALIGLYLGQRERLVRGPVRTRPPQVFREFDFGRGGPVRDVVRRVDSPGAPGQPQLLWAIQRGQAQSVPLPPRHQPPVRPLPVVLDEP